MLNAPDQDLDPGDPPPTLPQPEPPKPGCGLVLIIFLIACLIGIFAPFWVLLIFILILWFSRFR